MAAVTPKHCAWCGKPAHKATTRVFNPYTTGTCDSRSKLNGTRAEWTYQGAQKVVRKDVIKPFTWGSNAAEYIASVTVWDGETWKLNYDPFCTVTCALNFARAAHRGGYRRTQPIKASA